MGIRLGIGSLKIGTPFKSGGAWNTYWPRQSEVLFFGEISKITDGKLYNQKKDATDYLTVTGTSGSYTFKCPNTSPYISADTDYLWFRRSYFQRTVTEAELIGYDFTRTIVKYGNVAPYTLDTIMILSSNVSTNRMRDDFDLSLWWDNTLSFHGNLKGNRGSGKSTFTPDVSTLMTGITNYYKFNELAGNLIDIVSSNDGVVIGATQGVEGGTAYSFDGTDKIELELSHTFITTASFTVAFWMKIGEVNLTQYVIDKVAVGTSRIAFYRINDDIGFQIKGDSVVASVSVSYPDILTAGNWILIGGERNVSTDKINIIVNGVAFGTPVTDTTTAKLGPLNLKFGADQGATLPFTGLIKKAGIWPRVLTTAEWAEIYNSGNGLIYPF